MLIPAFNVEPWCDDLVARLAHGFAAVEGRFDAQVWLVFVDDGSRDESWRALVDGAGSRPWLRLVRLRRNFGQTAALSAGFDRALGELIVPLDADMQNDPADVPALLDRLDEELERQVGVKFFVPDNPTHCVIKGTAAVLEALPERDHLLIKP